MSYLGWKVARWLSACVKSLHLGLKVARLRSTCVQSLLKIELIALFSLSGLESSVWYLVELTVTVSCG